MCIGPMQGLYDHEWTPEKMAELRANLKFLFHHMTAVRLKDFHSWWLPQRRRMKNLYTIGNLFFNPYMRCKKRGRWIKDAIDAEQLKIHNEVAKDFKSFIMYKYWCGRRNVEHFDYPYVVWWG